MGEKEFLVAYRGWVYACTNAIAQPLAEMELMLQKRIKKGKAYGWETVQEHEALQLLNHVNDWMTFADLKFYTAAMMEIDGNAYWYLPGAKSSGRKPVEIWPLDPTAVSVVKSKENYIDHYTFRNEAGADIRLEPSEVIHFMHFNPQNQYRGRGTVEAASLAIDTDTFAAEWQRNFFGNSAMPAAILKTTGKVSDEQYNRILGSWNAKFRGYQNSNKLAILDGGLEYTSLTPTSREMQFSESRKNTRDEILAIFRVPKVVLGITEDVNLASAKASEYTFNKFVIKPKMQFFVSRLNEFFLPLFGLNENDWRFTYADPIPENLDEKRLDRDSGVNNSYITINEARAMMSPAMPALPEGDVILVSSLKVPMSSPSNPTKAAKHIYKSAMIEYEHPVDQKKLAGKRGVYVSEQIVATQKTFMDLNTQLNEQLQSNLKQKSVSRLLTKIGHFKKSEASSLLKLIFTNYTDWVGLLYNATKEKQSQVLADSGKVALAQVGVDAAFDLANPRAVAWVTNNALANSTSYSDTMREDITDVVTLGVEEGASIDDISAGIETFFNNQSEFRAMRIARTEVIDAYAQGNLEGYKQSNVVTGKSWLADDSACGVCAGNADAGVIGLDETFPSGDDAPTAHPNCECALQPVTGGDAGSGE
jgi:HK97 family phage portal protein